MKGFSGFPHLANPLILKILIQTKGNEWVGETYSALR